MGAHTYTARGVLLPSISSSALRGMRKFCAAVDTVPRRNNKRNEGELGLSYCFDVPTLANSIYLSSLLFVCVCGAFLFSQLWESPSSPRFLFFFFFWFLFLNLDRMYCGPLSYGACTQPPSPYVSSMQTLKIPTPWSTSFVCRRRSRIFYHFSLKRNSKPSATDVFSLVFSSPLLESQTKFEP